MRIKKYDKLVRDRIPDIIRAQGKKMSVVVADDDEYRKRLIDKLQEEFDEYKRDGTTEELADMLEVIRAIIKCDQLSWDELEQVRIRKKNQRGGFEKRLILEHVTE